MKKLTVHLLVNGTISKQEFLSNGGAIFFLFLPLSSKFVFEILKEI